MSTTMQNDPQENRVPWWKPTLDAGGRLVTSNKPVRGLRRRSAEVARNTLVVAVVIFAIVVLITRDVVVAGIAFWIVLLAVIALHIFTSRRGSS
ncbi:MAG: hypothetical protein ACLP2J_12670 [Acidimicrobiales bacterium]